MTSTRTRWDQLRVWAYMSPTIGALETLDRLAALSRWKSGDPHPYVWFMRGVEEVAAPAEVDWTDFPEERAREAAAGWRR